MKNNCRPKNANEAKAKIFAGMVVLWQMVKNVQKLTEAEFHIDSKRGKHQKNIQDARDILLEMIEAKDFLGLDAPNEKQLLAQLNETLLKLEKYENT